MPNLLERVGDDLSGPVWIDMRTPPNEFDALRADTKTLALSVLSCVLPETIEKSLQRMSLDSADYAALAKAVWKEVIRGDNADDGGDGVAENGGLTKGSLLACVELKIIFYFT